jgi:hypothetical protein
MSVTAIAGDAEPTNAAVMAICKNPGTGFKVNPFRLPFEKPFYASGDLIKTRSREAKVAAPGRSATPQCTIDDVSSAGTIGVSCPASAIESLNLFFPSSTSSYHHKGMVACV